jgi:ABC-2 type transport system ATP-binding protein
MSCIDVSHLSKSYGSVHAVDDLNLSIKSGQVFGFLGPNGAGKSTTIKLLTTLIPPSSGSLSILGIDAVSEPLKIRHKIGVVLQQPSYEPTLSVEKSLEKYGMMWNIPKIIRKKRMEQLLIDFDLVEIRKKRLFLDEPTVGLDPSARRKLLDYLKNKVKTGLTIFYTTHILSEAEYLCDQIAIIDKGKIVTVDSPDALKNRFGKEKTIKIHLLEKQSKINSLLSGIIDCKIDFETGTNIIIRSEQSELVLLKILKILNDNGIDIEDLSAVPTNLEEIFLNMVRENASNN